MSLSAKIIKIHLLLQKTESVRIPSLTNFCSNPESVRTGECQNFLKPEGVRMLGYDFFRTGSVRI